MCVCVCLVMFWVLTYAKCERFHVENIMLALFDVECHESRMEFRVF